ncbi:hypothetical protein AB0I77_46560 [Streptomyces sp. NPDC050619]|uniref:hypothetical protein n=1 Tax=Streptomyces sp. NPDC050619 TaxID=3157214 RepID=UPI003419FFE0
MTGPYDDIWDLRWRHRCDMSFQLPADADGRLVKAAFQQAVVRFPMLRTTVTQSSDGVAGQIVLPASAADDLIFAEESLEKVDDDFLKGLVHRGYDLNVAVILARGPDRSVVIVKASHFYMDGMGFALLRSHVIGLIEKGVVPKPQEIDTAHDEILAFEAGPRARRESERKITVLRDAAARAVEVGAADSHVMGPEYLVGRTSSTTLDWAGLVLAQRYRVSRAAILLSLFITAYQVVMNRPYLWMAACSSNRVLPAELRYVGLQTRSGFFLSPAGSADENFSDYARKVGECLLTSLWSVRHDPDRLLQEFRARGFPDGPQLFFNYSPKFAQDGPPGERPSAGQQKIDAHGFGDFEWSVAPSGRYALELNFSPRPEGIGLVVEHDDTAFPKHTVAAMARAIAHLASHVASQEDEMAMGRVKAYLAGLDLA